MGAHAVRLSNVDIDAALDAGDFEVLFQPIHDLRDGSLLRMETFVRWRHRTLGLLPPGAFISFFETQGRMSELTRYVLQHAIEAYTEWRGPFGPGFSINLALSDIVDETFAAHFEVTMRNRGFPTDCITFECPMPPVDVDVDQAAASYARLAATGARLAIEVRGRANEFLKTVDPFPFHEIKTGGAAILRFARTVRGPGLTAISELIELAASRGALIAAVGVEDQASLVALRGIGFAAAQGNHLGRVGDLQNFTPSRVNDVRTLIGLQPVSDEALGRMFRAPTGSAETVPASSRKRDGASAQNDASPEEADRPRQQNDATELRRTALREVARRRIAAPADAAPTSGEAGGDGLIDRLSARIAREIGDPDGDLDLDAATARKAAGLSRPARRRPPQSDVEEPPTAQERPDEPHKADHLTTQPSGEDVREGPGSGPNAVAAGMPEDGDLTSGKSVGDDFQGYAVGEMPGANAKTESVRVETSDGDAPREAAAATPGLDPAKEVPTSLQDPAEPETRGREIATPQVAGLNETKKDRASSPGMAQEEIGAASAGAEIRTEVSGMEPLDVEVGATLAETAAGSSAQDGGQAEADRASAGKSSPAQTDAHAVDPNADAAVSIVHDELVAGAFHDNSDESSEDFTLVVEPPGSGDDGGENRPSVMGASPEPGGLPGGAPSRDLPVLAAMSVGQVRARFRPGVRIMTAAPNETPDAPPTPAIPLGEDPDVDAARIAEETDFWPWSDNPKTADQEAAQSHPMHGPDSGSDRGDLDGRDLGDREDDLDDSVGMRAPTDDAEPSSREAPSLREEPLYESAKPEVRRAPDATTGASSDLDVEVGDSSDALEIPAAGMREVGELDAEAAALARRLRPAARTTRRKSFLTRTVIPARAVRVKGFWPKPWKRAWKSWRAERLAREQAEWE